MLDDEDENKDYMIKNSELYFNKNFSKISDDELKKASPFHLLSPDFPCTLLQHGDADTLVPFTQSTRFYEKAYQMGIDIRLDVLKGAGHSDQAFKSQQNLSEIFAFINSKLN